jgi:signal transduction histidine kinase/CheY-like chemotaxis protein
MSDGDFTARERLLRFDLAAQRNHIYVYSGGFVLALIGSALGVFELQLRSALLLWSSAIVLALVFSALYRRGANRKLLNALWIAGDIFFVCVGVYATGGIESPWFIWYLTTSSATAFVIGKRAAQFVSVINAVVYIALLFLMGQAHWGNDVLYLAFTRMLFLGGASFFFLQGIGNLQEKRMQIRRMELEESRKVRELTRVTEELNARTEELSEANRRIQEADRLKSQFLANMSHELRTPMNSIIGFSEILVDRLETRVEAKHLSFLRHILASGQHLLGIINDILDLSKIEAGKMEIYPESFAVAPVVESVCHVMRGMTRTTTTFVVDIPDDLPRIETDLAKFKQVLFNLISNAVKFSPADKPVRISARYIGSSENDGTITVAVQDQGIGIEAKHHAVIFEEFRQVDGTAKREFGGTGLGLALVKKFIELQGGRVTVDSSPGEGSTFSFTLPVQSRAAVVSRTPDTEELAATSDLVLVVEDDAHAYDLIAAALRSAGYLSIRARHGEEALKLARDSHPVAVTLDLVLPGVDGWEVLKRLKTDPLTREIPVVIISMVDNRELGVALGADDYFIKPVDRERLLERIRRLTSGHGPRARLLLIDDDAAVHSLLEEELAALGYDVESAFTGESGFESAKDLSPDVIILDLMMPGMSGFEVAGMLKDHPRTANIPILVLTSKDLTNDDRRELQSKVTSFVQKGQSAREQLVREIRRLEQRRITA